MNTKNKTGKFRIIFRFLKGNIRFFVGTLLFSVLFTACNALIPQIVKYTADHILVLDGIPDGLNVRQTLLLAALLVAASAVLSGVFNYLSKMCLAKGSENFLKSIRDTLYHHTQYLPFSWHVKHQTGEIIQRCTSDVEVIRNFVCRQLPEVFRICFLIVLYLGIMFSMNVQITLAAAAFFPVIIGYSCYFYSRIGKRFQDADEAEGALSSTVQENLTGVRVVRAFGREKYEIDRFDEKNNAYSNLWVYLGKLMSVYWASGDLITNLQVLVVMVTGVVFAVNGQITLGEFMAFISYNASLTWPVRSLGRIISDMSKAGVSMERVAYILEAEEEDAAVKCEAKSTDRNENAENIAKKKKAGQSEATLAYKIPARTAEQTSEDSENKGCGEKQTLGPVSGMKPAMDGDICFRDVSFGYSPDHPVLKNINFTIPSGSTFAILGTTGSGKSTLLHMIGGLDVPTSGQVIVDGQELNHMTDEELTIFRRRNIGFVFQQYNLVPMLNVWENIVLPVKLDGRRPDEKYIDEIIEILGLRKKMANLPNALSGGQQQRVAIARALAFKPAILLADEPTGNLDSMTSSDVLSLLKVTSTKFHQTLVMITHNNEIAQLADRIIRIEDGKIVQ